MLLNTLNELSVNLILWEYSLVTITIWPNQCSLHSEERKSFHCSFKVTNTVFLAFFQNHWNSRSMNPIFRTDALKHISWILLMNVDHQRWNLKIIDHTKSTIKDVTQISKLISLINSNTVNMKDMFVYYAVWTLTSEFFGKFYHNS